MRTYIFKAMELANNKISIKYPFIVIVLIFSAAVRSQTNVQTWAMNIADHAGRCGDVISGTDGYGNIFVTTDTPPYVDGYQPSTVSKISPEGKVKWVKEIKELITSICGDPWGNFFILAYDNGISKYYLRKYDGNGTVLWESIIDDFMCCNSSAVSVSAEGDLFLTGTRFKKNASGYIAEQVFTLCKMDTAGNVQWVRTGNELLDPGTGRHLKYLSWQYAHRDGSLYMAVSAPDFPYPAPYAAFFLYTNYFIG
jgi:hypothetical protein